MSGADELLHQMKHASSQQAGDDVPVAFGHIASYDPKLHRVRLIIPSWRDEVGNPVLTSWMPISTGWVGNGVGLQVAPVGGATAENPTQGEACIIQLVRKNQGVSLCAGMFFNQTNAPPATDLQPGEAILKAAGGSFVRFNQDKSIILDTSENNGKVTVNAGTGEVEVNADKATVTCATEATLKAPTITLEGETTLRGNATVTGNLNVEGEIIWPHGRMGGAGQAALAIDGDVEATGEITGRAGTVSSVTLAEHVHAGVETGGGSTSPPTGGT